ncbi:hypothetical protein [Sphingomonas faeni]|uniref:hypothetical protein n=1 Tax=Sphingomonas faeni TaxID=185950 RepID=UPI0033576B0E
MTQRELRLKDKVSKARVTSGRVFAVGGDDYMTYSVSRVVPMVCRFNNQIQVQVEVGRPVFAANGDSGSLLCDEDGFGLGMLFYGSTANTPNRVALTNFSSVYAVFAELYANLLQGGSRRFWS